MKQSALPEIILGSTGVRVTRFGLGGEGILRTYGKDSEAVTLIRRALELGVTYFESARAYADSERYLGQGLGQDRTRIFLTSKSAQRTKAGALRDLETSLANLKTDYLDLWQVHDVREEKEWQQIQGPGGALEAFEQARDQGKVRFIGITGHHDPFLLRRALWDYPFSTVLIPVNIAEAHLPGFLDQVLPAAREKGMAVIGMKVMGGGAYTRAGLSPDALLRWALSTPVTVLTVGCASASELERNLQSALAGPLPEAETDHLLRGISSNAAQAAYYRGVLAETPGAS